MRIYLMATLSLVGSVVILGLGMPVASEASQQKGQAQFIRCAACHSTRAADRPSTGPHLEGIVGRKAGAVTNFTYSERLRKGDFIWDEARIDAFLAAPQSTDSGMCLTFRGLAKAEDRAALLAYLKAPAS